MIALMQVQTKNDKTFSHFDFVSEEKDFNSFFKEKNIRKYLEMIRKNDLFLGRTTVFAINYNDEDKFAKFCLVENQANQKTKKQKTRATK